MIPGRPGDNRTIWFSREPSQALKEYVEGVMASRGGFNPTELKQKAFEGFKKSYGVQGESSTSSASQEAPVRRVPKSKKTKTVLDVGTANVTKSEIESKIQENKDHHKDNCNGIIPF